MYCKYLCQPCVTGIYKHYILIPEYLRGTLSEKEIEIILTHELTHIKKRDTAAKTIIFVLSSLNWFNLITVSYTHLDVYKRQVLDTA